MSRYEFLISLRIRHPSIDPAEITEALSLEPQHSWRAGQGRSDSAGHDLGGVYRDSYWMARLMSGPQLAGDSMSIESEILRILGSLRRSFQFLERLSVGGGRAELLISLFAREEFRLELLPESLSLLGRFGITIVLDVHPNPPGRSAALQDA